MAYFKLDRFYKRGTGIRRTECESLHVAIDAVAIQPLRIYGISALELRGLVQKIKVPFRPDACVMWGAVTFFKN